MAIGAASTKVQLRALTDEATGYQAVRPDEDLRHRYNLFLREERDRWEGRWTDDVVRAVCKLYRKPHTPDNYSPWMQGFVGKAYDLMFGPEVMVELRRRNPEPSKGSNHHQFFRARVQRGLKRELPVLQALAETSATRNEFWDRMRTRYRGAPLQTRLWS